MGYDYCLLILNSTYVMLSLILAGTATSWISELDELTFSPPYLFVIIGVAIAVTSLMSSLWSLSRCPPVYMIYAFTLTLFIAIEVAVCSVSLLEQGNLKASIKEKKQCLVNHGADGDQLKKKDPGTLYRRGCYIRLAGVIDQYLLMCTVIVLSLCILQVIGIYVAAKLGWHYCKFEVYRYHYALSCASLMHLEDRNFNFKEPRERYLRRRCVTSA